MALADQGNCLSGQQYPLPCGRGRIPEAGHHFACHGAENTAGHGYKTIQLPLRSAGQFLPTGTVSLNVYILRPGRHSLYPPSGADHPLSLQSPVCRVFHRRKTYCSINQTEWEQETLRGSMTSVPRLYSSASISMLKVVLPGLFLMTSVRADQMSCHRH